MPFVPFMPLKIERSGNTNDAFKHSNNESINATVSTKGAPKRKDGICFDTFISCLGCELCCN
jgi:hypothetical protein